MHNTTLALFKSTAVSLANCISFPLCLQLYKEIEICTKDTKVIRFDKAESCSAGYGNLEFYTVKVPVCQSFNEPSDLDNKLYVHHCVTPPKTLALLNREGHEVFPSHSLSAHVTLR